ncbi:MAG: proteasome accessory factor PafA2 family protein [Acidobacteriota bacterium]
MSQECAGRRRPPRVVKVCGADIELGNFYLGAASPLDSPGLAARALLAGIRGVPARSMTSVSSTCACSACTARRKANEAAADISESTADASDRRGVSDEPVDPQDMERRFLPENGGCAYIDLDHLELCLPEVTSAFDHVACWHAMLRLTRRALLAANAAQPSGRRLYALVNNSDGRGHSYGSHLDFLITREAWDNIFRRRMHYLLYLAAYQVSSITFTGQGKVGAEDGCPDATFQLSQRADFMETLTGQQTTFCRPIVNSRDEPLAGKGLARLHNIFFDSTLCHVASVLKVGVTQIVLAMIEAEHVDATLVLDDPLEALSLWSRDPLLSVRAALASGTRVTAVELQRRFWEQAAAFAESGELDEVVPRAREILALWDDTLQRLEARDFPALARRVDWALKLSLLGRVMHRRPELDWTAAPIRHLDHVYASLDEHDGLYWSCEANGGVDRLVSDEDIDRFTVAPPDDTRAWTRAMLLRTVKRGDIERVDWDSMLIRTRGGGARAALRPFDMPHPGRLGRADAEPVFAGLGTLDEILDVLEAQQQEDPHAAARAPAARGVKELIQ